MEEEQGPDGGDSGRRRLRRRRRPVGSPADMPDHPPATDKNTDKYTGKNTDHNGDEHTDKNAPRAADHEPAEPPTERRRRTEMDKAERGLRGLVGAGPSQLTISAAMRARDGARPTAEELAAAAELPLVRRNYVPPDDAKSGK